MKRKIILLIIIFSLISVGTVYAVFDPIDRFFIRTDFKQNQTSDTPTYDLEASLEQFEKKLNSLREQLNGELGDNQSKNVMDVVNYISKHQTNQLKQIQYFSDRLGHQQLDKLKDYTLDKKDQESGQMEDDVIEILSELTNE